MARPPSTNSKLDPHASAFIGFKIEVAIGPSLRHVCVEATKKIKASTVILTSCYGMINAWKKYREMKKDKKYLLENVQCGVLRIKSNGKIEVLQFPKEKTERVRGMRAKHYSTMMINEHKESSPSSASSTIDEHDLFSIEI
ncbi:hypothetical protein CsatB_028558 [Cannabis sativa]